MQKLIERLSQAHRLEPEEYRHLIEHRDTESTSLLQKLAQ